MIRINAYFLYQVGGAIHPILGINSDWTKTQIRMPLWQAESWLDILLNKSVYRLQTCRASGDELLETIRRIQNQFSQAGVNLDEQIDIFDYYLLTTQAKAFETVLGAELQWGQLYLVSPKGGYDLLQLTENGIVIFPTDLSTKAPEAINDAKEAARCIAFELPTAAAFHLHRINEIVMRRYYDVVTSGKPRPEMRNIGAYIDAMKNHQVGDKVVFGALSTLAHLHRNPVLHPDQRLESVEEAIALLGSINTVVSYMLKTLPPPTLQLISPPHAETKDKK